MTSYTKEDALIDAIERYLKSLHDVETFVLCYDREADIVDFNITLTHHHIFFFRPMYWLQWKDRAGDIEVWLYYQIARMIEDYND